MSGNSECRKENKYEGGEILLFDIVVENAELLVRELENRILIGSLYSRDALILIAPLFGISGTESYLKLVAKLARRIMNHRYNNIITESDYRRDVKFGARRR